MNLKKTVTGIFVSTLVFGIVATTAIAENYNVNKYNKSYNYSQTQKDMHYTFSGNSNQAITSASNITRNSSRYISTYVAKKSRKNDSVITSDSDNIMTTNAGVYSAISRNQTDSSVYFYHCAIMKPSSSYSYVIASKTYSVSQIPG